MGRGKSSEVLQAATRSRSEPVGAPVRKLREPCRRARDVRFRRVARGRPGQYRFFGGNDRLICLRRRETAAAFLRLRTVVGFS